MGFPDGGSLNPTLKINFRKRVSTTLDKIDTPSLNIIPDDISTTDEIESAIGALTNHVRTVVEKWERERPDNSASPDDAEIGEYLAHSIDSQRSHASPPHGIAHINLIEDELQNKASLKPKDNLPPVSLSKVQTLVKSLKTKNVPSLNGISNKAIVCFFCLTGLTGQIFYGYSKIAIFLPPERGGGNRHS
ncbi:hypothetical protein EVAR_47875_1 [Eumeta japonica]|uniref:Uncharacterized protein n=1 Tax=Eumeta variegata TaxID=151549 RepID=A0A4C1ZZ19_EUMVA|nr:hypothetical protein EVAR_47875_1 [Eumeta japonica]